MDNLFDTIKGATRIEEVVSEYITLRRVGRNYIGVCPFHGDRSPSLTVSPNKQIYKCFACGAGGDVFTFIVEHLGITSWEAAELLAQRAGITIDRKESPEQDKARLFRDAIKNSLEAATNCFVKNLPLAEEFLIQRGLPMVSNIVQEFRIGYAQGNCIKNELSKHFGQDVLIHADLLKSTDRGIYDTFRERIIFPFIDVSGKVIGFTGRYTGSGNYPKYLNTGETSVYSKGKALFGIYQSKRDISEKGFVYLVEGQFDVVSLHKVGVRNVVAGSGTALSSDQINLIGRFTDKVRMIYDADSPGIKACIANIRKLLESGFSVQCVKLEPGTDPDNLANQLEDETAQYLLDQAVSYVHYLFSNTVRVSQDPEERDKSIQEIADLIGLSKTNGIRKHYCKELSELSLESIDDIKKRINLNKVKINPNEEAPIRGIDELSEFTDDFCIVTSDLSEFTENYGECQCIYVTGRSTMAQLTTIRKSVKSIVVEAVELQLKGTSENPVLWTLSNLFRIGVQGITVLVRDEDSESFKEVRFLNYYVDLYSAEIEKFDDTSDLITQCCEVIAAAEESSLLINLPKYTKQLGIGSERQLKALIKPYQEKRKAKKIVSEQRNEDDEEDFDPEKVPDYVEENETYKNMLRQYGFYPKLNKDGDPVSYMFKGDNQNGFYMVGDFFMQPLLHIMSDQDEQNKRVVKIYRRYYKQPIFVEFNSKALLKKTSIEERLIMLEAVNFSNGTDKNWTKIKEWMSRNFIACEEITVYGNQQQDGFSRREDENFFAFANGIYHHDNGEWKFSEVDETGIVSHCGKNYYLPAFSAIYAGSGKTDKYENISKLIYKEQPENRKVSFERWAYLMDKVYAINNNGKWALVFAIMSAFRLNIHAIDRLFTAPFFMGPMSSGKTQIAISIRSLFIDKNVPIFNLNTGTDAAMSSLMATFKDVPIVLDEYNNKDISDVKFQALKGIVYDGDGKQKRKGTSKEIENDKVFAPVVICGQETPQRDDNALMSRVIVCEVAKPKSNRSEIETALFEEIKRYESADQYGLSHILVEILKLRPIIQRDFSKVKSECYRELKANINAAGEIDRMMKTASLFLAMMKIIEGQPQFKMPFSYNQFFSIVSEKVIYQMSMITQSDKVANFFNTIDKLIDTDKVIYGWELDVDAPKHVTFEDGSSRALVDGEEILYLRVAELHICYTSSPAGDDISHTTLRQNLRSNPAYIGVIKSRRFSKKITVDKESGEYMKSLGVEQGKLEGDTRVTRVIEPVSKNTSCMAFNYNKFREIYGIEFRRDK